MHRCVTSDWQSISSGSSANAAVLTADLACSRNSVLGRLHVSFDERFARYSSTLNSRVLIPSSPRSSVDAASRSGTEPKSLTRDTRLTLFDLAESLGVLEVRTAFSLYLECVRVRMLEEGSASWFNLLSPLCPQSFFRGTCSQRCSSCREERAN
jgi:hypothetical protein